MPVMLWYTKKPSPRPAPSFGTNCGHGRYSGHGTNCADRTNCANRADCTDCAN